MTQPNQSERERFVDSMWNYYGVEEAGDLRYWGDIYDSVVEPYITANYTPNTKLKALIEASEKLNLEFHGRPDCKNCSLQEQLAELTKAKEEA